jgi:hypothetical protein
VLIDLGDSFHFISQAVTDKLRLEAVKAGKSKVKMKAPLPIMTVNSEPLRAIVVIWQMGLMHNGTNKKHCYTNNLVVSCIAHYCLIWVMTWLQKQNPDIHWETGVWHCIPALMLRINQSIRSQ